MLNVNKRGKGNVDMIYCNEYEVTTLERLADGQDAYFWVGFPGRV